MYTATSYTISEDQKSVETPLLEWKFQIENGNTGELTISDPLLETEALANERAIAEFIKNSYEFRESSFKTYRTDFELDDIINVMGLPYIITSVYATISQISMVTSIKAVRYE